MASARPPRSYRSARERVAHRRANSRHAVRVRTSRRRGAGCSSIIAGGIAAVLLSSLVLLVLSGFATRTLDSIQQSDPRLNATSDSVRAQEELPRADLEPFTILLMGVDTRDNETDAPRSDTLIVVHVDPQEQWASMLSIPRDSVVEIPYAGYQKINVAYPFGYLNAEEIYGEGTAPAEGGGALAAETVENFLGIPIDYTAQVDFRGFERLIDIMGGLVIDVPKPLLDAEYPTENYGFERLYIPAGLQVFDGATALRYARSRHSETDFDRSCRQQRVLRAMLRQARDQNILDQASRLPEIVENLERSVATTLPVSDLGVLYSLADLARELNTDRIIQMSINPDNVRIVSEQGSDIYWDDYDIERLVARMMRGPASEDDTVVAVQVMNGAGIGGLAGQVTRVLASEGINAVTPTDAPRRYTRTTIIDYSGQVAAREQLADLLGLPQSQIRSAPDDTDPPAQEGVDLVLVLGDDYQEEWTIVRADAPTPEPPPPAPPVGSDPASELPNLPTGCSPDF